MTYAPAAKDGHKSEFIFTGERLFGLLVGGLCAPPIGLAGANAFVTLFDSVPGSYSASPEAFKEALWVCGLMAGGILLIWGLLALGRRVKRLASQSLLALGWLLAIAFFVFLLDAHDGDFDGAVFHPVFVPIVVMMWIISVPTALTLGSLALVAAHLVSTKNAMGIVASGALIAVAVSLVWPRTPIPMGADGIFGALGFWLPTGVFTMGCCAAASGARWN